MAISCKDHKPEMFAFLPVGDSPEICVGHDYLQFG